jgi:hypothetical protein
MDSGSNELIGRANELTEELNLLREQRAINRRIMASGELQNGIENHITETPIENNPIDYILPHNSDTLTTAGVPHDRLPVGSIGAIIHANRNTPFGVIRAVSFLASQMLERYEDDINVGNKLTVKKAEVENYIKQILGDTI